MKQLPDVEEYNEWLEERTGDLFHIDWLRVVLDECHMIKNYKTHCESIYLHGVQTWLTYVWTKLHTRAASSKPNTDGPYQELHSSTMRKVRRRSASQCCHG